MSPKKFFLRPPLPNFRAVWTPWILRPNSLRINNHLWKYKVTQGVSTDGPLATACFIITYNSLVFIYIYIYIYQEKTILGTKIDYDVILNINHLDQKIQRVEMMVYSWTQGGFKVDSMLNRGVESCISGNHLKYPWTW